MLGPNHRRTLGDSFLHIDRIDRFVRVERPLIEYAHEPADAVAERIARYVAEIIEDGSTLHVDLGRIPNERICGIGAILGFTRTSSPIPCSILSSRA